MIISGKIPFTLNISKALNPVLEIIQWYLAEGRKLPWREISNPYNIWISEIILQQTRIDQGTGYYLRFIERFPDLESLAAASQDEVLKYWEGLGYYSRARNLHHTAKDLVENYQSQFPNTHQELQKLKGIGHYTSRAIASISFGEKVGVVDGNVFRVLTRYLADSDPIDKPATRNKFQAILDSWLEKEDSASFNQGIMDLGAMICTPKNPACSKCPVSVHCKAGLQGTWDQFPQKAKKLVRKTRYHGFFIVMKNQELLIRKRPQKGVWAGLWEIPNLEVTKEEWEKGIWEPGINPLGEMKHVFTHFDMMIRIYHADRFPGPAQEEDRFIPISEIPIFAFSRAVLKIFETWLPQKPLKPD